MDTPEYFNCAGSFKKKKKKKIDTLTSDSMVEEQVQKITLVYLVSKMTKNYIPKCDKK